MNSGKDEKTEALRRQIMEDADFLVETERADVPQITLSFQSLIYPERHVWIDTDTGEGGDKMSVDLEDWTYEGSWDNAVAAIEAEVGLITRNAVRAWLGGETLDACLQHCTGCKIELK